jgi:hypothetical protein
MKIVLNGYELPRQAEGQQTVGDVLSELRKDIYQGGKIVTQIRLDGQVLPDNWQRRQFLNTPVSQVRTLDLGVEEPIRLKRQTLQSAVELTGRLVQRAKPLGVKFRVGDEVAANNELAAFLDDLKLVLAGLDHSTRGNRDGNGPGRAIRHKVIETANYFLPTLDRIYKAQTSGDHVAIADELEYDLLDQISGLTGLLTEAEQSLESLTQVK